MHRSLDPVASSNRAERMAALCEQFMSAHPGLSWDVLGSKNNAAFLDLAPFGQEVTFRAAEDHPRLVQAYLRANQQAFRGDLAMPGWVLSDLYLMPGAIGLLRGQANSMPDAHAPSKQADERPILAAYYAAPSLEPFVFIGVSLLSLVPGKALGPWVKALTLRMLRASVVRGIAQWSSPSLRTHTRLGPLRLVGPPPVSHERADESFVYECDLTDPEVLAHCMERKLEMVPNRRVPASDTGTLQQVLGEAERGALIYIVPPGLDASDVLLYESKEGEGAKRRRTS